MADHDHILQVQVIDDCGQVIGVLVHIVAVPRLIGTPVTPAIMGDHSVTLLTKIKHLRFPGIARQRPSMREDDWLTLSPILIGNPGPVFHSYKVGRHILLSWNGSRLCEAWY